ncbi:MAG: transposase [Pseudomonadota bacterium]
MRIDKNYLSKTLGAEAFEKGVELITNVRQNMKPWAMKLLAIL